LIGFNHLRLDSGEEDSKPKPGKRTRKRRPEKSRSRRAESRIADAHTGRRGLPVALFLEHLWAGKIIESRGHSGQAIFRLV